MHMHSTHQPCTWSKTLVAPCSQPCWVLYVQVISSYLGSVTSIPQQYGSTITNASDLVGTPSIDSGNSSTAQAAGIIRWALAGCGWVFAGWASTWWMPLESSGPMSMLDTGLLNTHISQTGFHANPLQQLGAGGVGRKGMPYHKSGSAAATVEGTVTC